MAAAEDVASQRFESGLWLGFYEQTGVRFRQEQTMEFADGVVRGDGNDGLGSFRIEGVYRRHGDTMRLGWIKTYTGAHSVLYMGELDGQWIRGRWELDGGWGDAFAFAPAAVARMEARE